MNTQTKIEPPSFNALAAYESERERNRRFWDILQNVLFVADGMAGEMERAGFDVTTRKIILAKARAERLEI